MNIPNRSLVGGNDVAPGADADLSLLGGKLYDVDCGAFFSPHLALERKRSQKTEPRIKTDSKPMETLVKILSFKNRPHTLPKGVTVNRLAQNGKA